MNIDKDQTITSRNTRNRIIKENTFLVVLMGLGIGIVVYGVVPPYAESVWVLGAAFIIASCVGIYMMITTHEVARKLHERFNEQNVILETHTVILNKMDGSLEEISSTQKEMSSTLKEVSSTLKEVSSTQKEMSLTLKSIDSKIEQKL